MKQSKKADRNTRARQDDFDQNMKPRPKFKFHKPGSNKKKV